MADHTTLTASTPAPVAALAQSRAGGAPAQPPQPPARPPPGAGYDLGAGVTRTVARAPDPQRGMPLYRPLRIFALDPSVSHREGGITTINVAYEPLQEGPSSRLFHIDPHDPSTGADYALARLDDPYPALSGGYEPASSDARFHKQMLYAVCSNVYAAFRGALGREPTWGFERTGDPGRLWLQPHGFRRINAHYDKAAGTLCFGYDKSKDLQAAVRTLPGEYVFTCLSHDIIAHEMTHAILDGLRSHFTIPSHPDVPAFHEGFADLVAIFQRLGCRELVRSEIVANRGRPDQAALLADIARQAGHVTGCAGALRSAIASSEVQLYDDTLAAHALGAVLVGAVFDAFLTVFRCKTARYLRLATDGTGVLRDGALPADLADVLAEKTSALASQFQALIIRAIDYCPPVDIRFGEFLRAMVTADLDLVPDDPFGYREALIDAFLRRRILPRGVSNVSQRALLWNTPRLQHAPLAELSFARLRFAGDPGCPADSEELSRQASALGAYIAQPHLAQEFGLVPPGAPGFTPGGIGLPTVMSIRSARRIGPSQQIVFDLVAEVVQRCEVAGERGISFPVYGGSTVIFGPEGEIRYIISKSVQGPGRIARRAQFLAGPLGVRYWTVDRGAYRPREGFFAALHAGQNA